MNIAITFRHLDASEPVKTYATEKIGRVQKFLRQPMRAKVTLSLENKKHCCEAEVSAGSGHFVAHDSNDDMYAAIDKVMDKLERQISQAHGAQIARKKGADGTGAFSAAAVESGEIAAPPEAE